MQRLLSKGYGNDLTKNWHFLANFSQYKISSVSKRMRLFPTIYGNLKKIKKNLCFNESFFISALKNQRLSVSGKTSLTFSLTPLFLE